MPTFDDMLKRASAKIPSTIAGDHPPNDPGTKHSVSHSFYITRRAEMEWIVAHDPRAIIRNHSINRGATRTKIYKSLARNIPHMMKCDMLYVTLSSDAIAQAYHVWHDYFSNSLCDK